mmetsp:Transcript_85938/g.257470  ORF Transcript_85938/g.257470 Transcript_85938/m.257470 type:complete len:355 (-) Transcript_85938:330-1394(-)
MTPCQGIATQLQGQAHVLPVVQVVHVPLLQGALDEVGVDICRGKRLRLALQVQHPLDVDREVVAVEPHSLLLLVDDDVLHRRLRAEVALEGRGQHSDRLEDRQLLVQDVGEAVQRDRVPALASHEVASIPLAGPDRDESHVPRFDRRDVLDFAQHRDLVDKGVVRQVHRIAEQKVLAERDQIFAALLLGSRIWIRQRLGNLQRPVLLNEISAQVQLVQAAHLGQELSNPSRTGRAQPAARQPDLLDAGPHQSDAGELLGLLQRCREVAQRQLRSGLLRIRVDRVERDGGAGLPHAARVADAKVVIVQSIRQVKVDHVLALWQLVTGQCISIRQQHSSIREIEVEYLQCLPAFVV